MRLFVVVQGDEIVVTSETDFRAAYCKRPNFPQLKVRRRTGRRGFLAAELLGALAAAYLFRWLFEAIVMPAGPKIVDYGGRRECPLWVIRWGNRPACLWIAEDLGVLRFRLMVKRGHLYGPQASEGEAQHGPFCRIGRVGQGDEPRCEKHANSLRLSLIVALITIDASYTRPTIIQPPSPVYACRRLFKGRGGPRLMMTELEFLNRFQRQPNGVWACTKPINVKGPSGPVVIGQGASFKPGALFMGLDLAKELDQMAAKHGFAKPHSGHDSREASPA